MFYFYFLIIVFFSFPSYAYLDPGLGTIIVQSLIAGLGSILLFWNKFKNFIVSFFKKIKLKNEKSKR